MGNLRSKKSYYKILKNEQVIEYVCEQKKILPKPQEVDYPSEIYDMMVRCWSFNPADRPTFDDIYEFFDGLRDKGVLVSRRAITSNQNNQFPIYGERTMSEYGNKTVI